MSYFMMSERFMVIESSDMIYRSTFFEAKNRVTCHRYAGWSC